MQSTLHRAISDAINALGFIGGDFTIEHPSELVHGDYASNVALIIAKKNSKSPLVIANAIADYLQSKLPDIEEISVVAPGFINFFLNRNYLTQILAKATEEDWGANTSWKGKRVFIEYTDPNPFKEFHIGHLFTNAVGESLARIFEMSGAEVKRLCYQGDVGMHVAHAIWGLRNLGLTSKSTITANDMGRAYALGANAYKTDPVAQEEMRALNKKIYDRSDSAVNELYDNGRAASLTYFEDIYKLVDTKFDAYFFESEAGPRGKELVLNHPDIFPESDGARIFPGEQYGLHTRVFVNAEGLPTYEAKELALAKLKEERLGTYDLSVISTAKEITEYFKVLKAAMRLIYPDLDSKTEHVGHGMVRLTTGKMSSRTGDIIPALTFIDEMANAVAKKMESSGDQPSTPLTTQIALAAIKYSILKGSITQDSVFDKERALSFEGDSGPYLQYTHARLVSVLKRAEELGVEPKNARTPASPTILERLTLRFPEVVEAALAERAPHRVSTYLTELASAFNTFYQNERIADPTDEYAPHRVAVCQAVRQTLNRGLWVLGIKAPEAM